GAPQHGEPLLSPSLVVPGSAVDHTGTFALGPTTVPVLLVRMIDPPRRRVRSSFAHLGGGIHGLSSVLVLRRQLPRGVHPLPGDLRWRPLLHDDEGHAPRS